MRSRAKKPKPLRVLIADDHRLFAEALQAILASDERIEVVGQASDGSEAVALARGLAIRPQVRAPDDEGRLHGAALGIVVEPRLALDLLLDEATQGTRTEQLVVAFHAEIFARRVVENGGNGTDHGAAAPIFVVGKPVKGGVFGEQPSLTSTVDSGNLKYNVDFRSVYQTLIRDWLQADLTSVLGASFPELPIIQTA